VLVSDLLCLGDYFVDGDFVACMAQPEILESLDIVLTCKYVSFPGLGEKKHLSSCLGPHCRASLVRIVVMKRLDVVISDASSRTECWQN
jgi:hypothetical protein